MTLKRQLLTLSTVLAGSFLYSAAGAGYEVNSPDGRLAASIEVGEKITYSVVFDGQKILSDAAISMSLSEGIVFGENDAVRKTRKELVDQVLQTTVYQRANVRDNYNELTLSFKEFDLVFRAYDEAVAYRFHSRLKGDYTVIAEQADFSFAKDWEAYVPYVNKKEGLSFERQYFNSFENVYSLVRLTEWSKTRLAFTPLAVCADNGVKALVMEADLRNYPGMYICNTDGNTTLSGNFAPYPKTIKQGGHNNLQGMVESREDYIAKISGSRDFPWRILMLTDNDASIAINDIVWKLAPPQDINADFTWVRPGKVAWEWWNDWNIYGVDFKAGVNNDTYKYYIDFAAAEGIEYVILDEGWSVRYAADLLKVVPEIDLPELVKYAQSKGVGIILWAGYYAFDRDMENVCRHYAEMGVKGFKVDFMDRDDQLMVDFHERAAKMAAKYHLMLDFHGTYKPTGLSRTYPNVVNYEGVAGLEQVKWGDYDMVRNEVLVPFLRMAAGPMDYTQGAMRNAIRGNYRHVNSEPMSQGTRCRQLAEYVVFESPLNMLCDSPSNYMKEPLCTKYIAEIPVTWDESVAVNGEMGEYLTLARRRGDVWYVGSITDWNARKLSLDLSFIGPGKWKMEIFRDGPNADRAACDFVHTAAELPSDRIMNLDMAPGGGWVAKITKE